MHDATAQPPRHPEDGEPLKTLQQHDQPESGGPSARAQPAPAGFEVLGLLGRGGMGVVYHARQKKLNREVALKMILGGGHAGEQDRIRFLAEAEAIASLNHPGIVQVYEFGTHTDQPYFALEYCRGGSLAKQLDGTPQNGRVAARVVQRLAVAVQAAHENGIVHRDLKPANVLITERDYRIAESADETSRASSSDATLQSEMRALQSAIKITDFGLAKRLESDSDLTRSGAIVGTPSYMAPEQAGGSSKEVGPAADVYALGAILYELLTGRPPFKEATAIDTVLRVINDEPVSIRQLQKNTPLDLETICHKCLRKDPRRRYPSAKELARDLGRWLDGEPIQARPVGRVEKTVKWSKRNKPLAALYATLLGAAVLAVVALFAFQRHQFYQQLVREAGERQTRAAATMDAVETANIAAVPLIVQAVGRVRAESDPLLRQKFAAAKPASPARLRFALALLPTDPALADELLTFVPTAKAGELLVLRDALHDHSAKVIALWPRLADVQPDERLRLAALLADYLPADERWEPLAAGIVDHLVQLNPLELAAWSPALDPIRKPLTPPLVDLYAKVQSKLKSAELETQTLVAAASQFDLSATLLARYAADQPDTLAKLLQLADERHFAEFLALANAHRASVAAILESVLDRQIPADVPSSDERRESLAKLQANAAVALLQLNQPLKVWPLLRHSPDPHVRSYLIHRLSPLGADPKAIVERLDAEPDLTIRRALILSLGEFSDQALSPQDRAFLLPKMQNIYLLETDPGLHAAAEWLLRTWKQETWLRQINDQWAKDGELRKNRMGAIQELLKKVNEKPRPQWYVNTHGQMFVVIPGPVEILMGSPATEAGRQNDEPQHKRRISRTFAVAAKSVTVAEYHQFDPGYSGGIRQWSPTGECPVLGITWFSAAKYCNWLSKQEGLPESQWCYEPLRDPKAMPALAASTAGYGSSALGPLLAACGLFPGRLDLEFKPGMRLAPNYLDRTGYRLPTEAEVEYVTRAGAVTARYFGETEDLLAKYAWYMKNGKERSWPVGSRKPNELGFFDVHGNVYTWCQEAFAGNAPAKDSDSIQDSERQLSIDVSPRMLRGGSFVSQASVVRSAFRYNTVPTLRDVNFGLRPARSLPLDGFMALPLPAEGGKKLEK